MKNPYYEQTLRHIKRTSHRHRLFEHGVYCPIDFQYTQPDELTWCVDFGLILNDCYISVAWAHPRMSYLDRIDEEAIKLVQHLKKDDAFDGQHSTPIYQRIGKSRKKIKYYEMEIPDNPWIDALTTVKEQLKTEADFTIKPSMQIKWYDYGKFLSICAPVEIRSQQDVVSLIQIIKRILKHELTLEQAFPNYEYTRSDWLRDSAIMENVEPLDIQAHSVN